MKETIELKEIVQIIKKKSRIIIFLTMLVTIISGGVSYKFLNPMYESTTQFIVHDSSANCPDAACDTEISLQLILTYYDILKSPIILEGVIENLNLNYTIDELRNKTTITNNENSRIFSVKVKHSDKNIGRDIANAYFEVFQNHLEKHTEFNSLFRLISPADIESRSIGRTPMINTILGFVAGLAISIALALYLECSNKKVQAEEDIEEILEAPVFGSIPLWKKKNI